MKAAKFIAISRASKEAQNSANLLKSLNRTFDMLMLFVSLKDLKNSYGDGNSAVKAYKLIKEIDFKSMIAKVEDPLKVKLI